MRRLRSLPTLRVACLVTAGMLTLTLAACGGGGSADEASGSAASPTPTARDLVFGFPVEFRNAEASSPEADRVMDVLDILDGGSRNLSSCPLGDEAMLRRALPSNWPGPGDPENAVTPGDSFGDDSDTGQCVTTGLSTFYHRVPAGSEEDVVISALTRPGWAVTEPVDFYGGRSFTYCYENGQTGDPACGGAWFADNLAVYGTLHGPDGTAELAADWLASTLPLMLGPEVDEPTDPLASDMLAELGATYDTEDEDGYTALIRLRGTLSPFKKNVTNSLPGEFAAVSELMLTATASNTTDGRTTPLANMSIVAMYPSDSSACEDGRVYKAGTDGEGEQFCTVFIGVMGATELAPGETADLDTAAGLMVGDNEVRVEELAEDSDALATLNRPIGLYARVGDERISAQATVTSTSGCEAGSDTVATAWYIPLSGWADPICS